MQPVPDAWVNLITPWATWLRCPQGYTRSNNEPWLLHNKNGSACVLVCAFPALTLRSYPHYCDKKEHVQGDESLFLNIYSEVAWLIELCINTQLRLYKAALIDGLWHLSSHLSSTLGFVWLKAQYKHFFRMESALLSCLFSDSSVVGDCFPLSRRHTVVVCKLE